MEDTIAEGTGPVSEALRRQTSTSERATRTFRPLAQPLSIARSRAITEELK